MRYTFAISLFLILDLIVLTGCPYRCDGERDITNSDPPSEDEKQFLPYKKGDVVKFSDSLGNQDIYTCTFQGMRTDIYVYESFEDGDHCIEEFRTPQYATILATSDSLKKIDLFVSTHVGEAFSAGKDNYPRARILKDDTCLALVNCLDSMQVNNHIYYNVMHLWENSYFTVKEGLIQFTDTTGIIWRKEE